MESDFIELQMDVKIDGNARNNFLDPPLFMKYLFSKSKLFKKVGRNHHQQG